MAVRPAFARRVRLLGLTVLALASTGCASLLGSYDIAPNGLASNDERLRRMLVSGQAPTAFERMQRSAPADEMLHALYHGVLAYHAGEYAEAARALDLAAYIADERMTLSLSRAALSFVTSDLALHYEPSRTERLMIPWYAALARLGMGDTEGAAVEARRLSMLLQRFDDEDANIDARLRATLRYVAGAVFHAAGERTDADVAFRNAVALDSTLAPYRATSAETGTVLVVLEQGFVAHRMEQGLAVMLLPEEVHAIAQGAGEDRALAAGLVAGRILEFAAGSGYYDDRGSLHGGGRGSTLHVPAPRESVLPSTRTRRVCGEAVPAVNGTMPSDSAGGRECRDVTEEIDELPYLLKVAWPVYRSDYRPASALLRVSGGGAGGAALPGDAGVPFAAAADLSRSVMADFEAGRALLVARTIARGTAKLALTKNAERQLEERNEVAARLVGLIGNATNVLTERADTRSWHLLPAGMSVVRVELPAGSHELSVDVGGRTVGLGPVTVRPGALTVVPARAW